MKKTRVIFYQIHKLSVTPLVCCKGWAKSTVSRYPSQKERTQTPSFFVVCRFTCFHCHQFGVTLLSPEYIPEEQNVGRMPWSSVRLTDLEFGGPTYLVFAIVSRPDQFRFDPFSLHRPLLALGQCANDCVFWQSTMVFRRILLHCPCRCLCLP